MTLPRALSGGLSDLTSLNQRLIAFAADTHVDPETGEPVEGFVGPDGTPIGATGMDADGRPGDPDADDGEGGEETEEVRGRFSVEDPLEFNRVKEWIEANIFAGQTTGFTPLINSFVNDWDTEWRREQGLSPGEAITRGPTLEDLVDDQRFLNGAVWLPLTATGQVPPLFESTAVDDEGNEVPTPTIGVADPLTGVEFIEITESLDELKERPSTFFEVVKRTGTDLIRRARGGGVGSEDATAEAAERFFEDEGEDVPGGSPADRAAARRAQGVSPEVSRELNLPDYVKTAILHSDPAAEGREPRTPLPQIPQTQLVERLVNTQQRGSSGDGTTRRRIEFDKAHLTSQVADLYNRWMLEPGEAPSSIVNNIVNRYIREARSLWAGKSVEKDFDTFVRGELKKLPRYETIYEHKLPGQSEEEFIGSFRQPIARLGLRGGVTQRQTEAAVTSGGGPADQFRRVSRTREAQVANAGDLSQRLARTLQGVGVG